MAESFVNSTTRAVGVVTSSSAGAVGVQTNLITGISTTNVTVGDIVDNSNYIAGTKVSSIGVNSTTVDRDSTNTTAATSQTVKYLGLTTAYTSASGTKSIIIGGTFANNTTSEVELTIHLYDNSASLTPAIVSKVPVPNGTTGTPYSLQIFKIFETSSFVSGKTTPFDKTGSNVSSPLA